MKGRRVWKRDVTVIGHMGGGYGSQPTMAQRENGVDLIKKEKEKKKGAPHHISVFLYKNKLQKARGEKSLNKEHPERLTWT